MQKLIAGILLYFLPFLAFGKEQKSTGTTYTFELSVPADSELGKGVIDAFHEVFKKQGLKFRAVYFPMQRGLEEMKFGRVDGTLGRAGDIERNLGIKNFVRIDFPIATSTLSLWCHDDFRKLSQNLKLAVVHGGSIMNSLTPSIDKQKILVVPIQSTRSIVDMIKAHRVDCMLSTDLYLETTGIALKELSNLQRIDLVNLQAFPWISVQHQHLKAAIEDGLRKYNFSPSFRKKYQTLGSACQGRMNILCPDGTVFKSPIDLSNSP